MNLRKLSIFIKCVIISNVSALTDYGNFLRSLTAGLDSINRRDVFEEKALSFNSSERDIIKLMQQSLGLTFPLNFTHEVNVSLGCRKASTQLTKSLENFELWALKMYDANAKVPSGILNGNLNSYGDFDQCLSVASDEKNIRGQYCLAKVMFSVPRTFEYLRYLRAHVVSLEIIRSRFQDPSHVSPKVSEISWAVCVPSACQATEVEDAFKHKLLQLIDDPAVIIEVEVEQNMCQTLGTNFYDTIGYGFVAAITFFVVVLAISLYATVKCNEASHDWIAAFSLTTNWRSIISVERSSGNLSSVDGIRVITTIALVFVHKGMEMNFNPYSNRVEMNKFLMSPLAVFGRASFYYTETFLMLSGLLSSYTLSGRLQKSKKVNILNEIIGRYLRFVPSMASLMIFVTLILPHLGSGPNWPMIISQQSEICRKTWWRNILMIHNWFGFENICMTHTHHIGTDFMLFLVGLPLTIYLNRSPRNATTLISALAVSVSLNNFRVAYTLRLDMFLLAGIDVDNLFRTANHHHIIPPARFTAYAIGLLLGYMMRKKKFSKLTKGQVHVGWAVTAICLSVAVGMALVNQEYSPMKAACFTGFASTFWCIFVAWLVAASETDANNNLIKLLEWKYFRIGTNLSYGIYLVQFAVLHYNTGRRRGSTHFDFYNSVFDFNEVVLILVSAVFLTLFIEYPFSNIRKILIKFHSKPSPLKEESWKDKSDAQSDRKLMKFK